MENLGEYVSLGALLVTLVALVLAVFAFMKELQFKRISSSLKDMQKVVEENRQMFEYMHEVDSICAVYTSEVPNINYGSALKFKVLLNTLINPAGAKSLTASMSSIDNFSSELLPLTNNKVKNLLVHLWLNRWFHKFSIEGEFVTEFRRTFCEYPPPLLNGGFKVYSGD